MRGQFDCLIFVRPNLLDCQPFLRPLALAGKEAIMCMSELHLVVMQLARDEEAVVSSTLAKLRVVAETLFDAVGTYLLKVLFLHRTVLKIRPRGKPGRIWCISCVRQRVEHWAG